jgi:hypothetical protein
LVRREAVLALGLIGSSQEAVIAPLTRLVKTDESPLVRSAATEAMENLRREVPSSWMPWAFGALAAGAGVVATVWAIKRLVAHHRP